MSATSIIVTVVICRLMLVSASQQAANAKILMRRSAATELFPLHLGAILVAWERTRPRMARSDSAQASCAARQLSKVTKQ